MKKMFKKVVSQILKLQRKTGSLKIINNLYLKKTEKYLKWEKKLEKIL